MNQDYIAALNANASPHGVPVTPLTRIDNGKVVLINNQKPTTQKGRGGWLTSLISEAGGAGGAAGGAALGATVGSVVPVVGTAIGGLIGAGLGGFIGGTVGRGVENKVRDNQNFFGAGGSAKSAFKEGALSGVLSAGGEALQLAKAGKAVTGASTVLHPLENMSAGIAEKQAGNAYKGIVQSAGEGLQKNALGIAQGSKAKGIDKLGFGTSEQYLQAIKDAKIPIASPEAAGKAIERRLADTGKAISNLHATNNIPLNQAALDKLKQEIITEITPNMGIGKTGSEFAKHQLNKINTTNVKDLGGLWEQTKNIGNKINFGQNGDAVVADQSQVASIIRDKFTKFINDKIPGLAEQNAKYHNLSDIGRLVTEHSTNTTGGNLASRALSSQPVKSLEAKVGTGVSGVGQLMAGTGNGNVLKPLSKVTNNLVRQSPASLSGAIGGAQQMQSGQQDPNNMQLDSTQIGADNSYQPAPTNNTNDPTTIDQSQGQTKQTAYPLEQAISDYRSTSNPKVRQQIMDYYSFVSKSEAAQNKVDKVSVKAQDAASAGSQALNIVDTLQKSFQSAGGAKGRLAGSISNLSGKAGLNSSISVYNDAKTGFLSNVARALGEKGVLTDQDIIRVSNLFPSPTSTPQEAAAKWAMVKTIISGGVRRAQAAYGAGNQLSDILSQQGGAIMGTVSVSLPSDGQTVDASDVNNPINTILNEFNGNIDDNNIKATANIQGSKLLVSSIPANKLDANGQGGWVTGILPAVSSVTENGNRSADITFASTVASLLTPGMRIRTSRTVAAPTQCTVTNGSTQWWSKASPNKMTFTDNFTQSYSGKITAYPSATTYIGGRMDATFANGFAMGINSSGQIIVYGANAGAANFRQGASYQSVPLNKEFTIESSWATGTILIYLDGVLMSSVTTSGGTNPTTIVQGGDWAVGRAGSFATASSFWNGTVFSAAVYDAVISAATLRSHKNQARTGSETNLKSAYTFNGVATDLNTTTPNDLTANGSVVATTASTRYTTDANGVSAGTYDWAIVTAVTTTIATVFYPEGCAIPTSGGISAVDYSTTKSPLGFPKDSRFTITAMDASGTTTLPLANSLVAVGILQPIDNMKFSTHTGNAGGIYYLSQIGLEKTIHGVTANCGALATNGTATLTVNFPFTYTTLYSYTVGGYNPSIDNRVGAYANSITTSVLTVGCQSFAATVNATIAGSYIVKGI